MAADFMGFLGDTISNTGRALDMPTIFDWDTAAAREDAASGAKRTNGDVKRDVQSKAYDTNKTSVEKTRFNGNIYNYAGDVIGTYGQGNGTQGDDAPKLTYAQNAARTAAAAASADKARTIGQYDEQDKYIDNQLANLFGYESTGKTQLADAFAKGKSRLNEQKSSALAKYGVQRSDTKADFSNTSDDIDSTARNNYQALLSLLGSAGAGSSSAASVLTPYAVATQASKTRGANADVMGRNMRDLDTAETETNTSFDNNEKDLNEESKSKEYALMKDLETNRSTLLGQKADVAGNRTVAQGGDWQTAKGNMQGIIDRRTAVDKALSTMLDQYRNPYTVKDVATKTVSTKNYVNDMNGVATDANGDAADTDTSQAYLDRMAEEKKRKEDALVNA